MLRLPASVALVLLATAAPALALNNVPSDGTDARFFLCMVDGGTEFPIPLVGTACCNDRYCVVCDSNLNNCREITPSELRVMQTRPQLTPQTRPGVLAPPGG